MQSKPYLNIANRRKTSIRPILFALIALGNFACGQEEVLWREDWAEIPPERPITQKHVTHPHLSIHLYGGAVGYFKKSHHAERPNDPFYGWSGRIKDGAWATTLRDTRGPHDLNDVILRWRVWQTGGHSLRIVLRLANDSWLVSNPVAPTTEDWMVLAHRLDESNWNILYMDPNPTLGDPVEAPDLSDVLEVGFTDLQAGEGSPASSRVDWIELKRSAASVK